MTVINPNSISGITSITLPSGDSNVLTIHTNDGTERFRIDSSGNVKVGSAATISPDGDLFVTGVTTTGGHFAGSGANLTSLPAANITGTLPAISGANLTSLPAANITGTLPAISGANLTSLPAANLTGTLPAISGANLTGIGGTDFIHAEQISVSGVTTSNYFVPTAGQLGGRRNIVINGAMAVAQRDTSSTSTGYQTVDRFRIDSSGLNENMTQAQVDVASGTAPYTSGFRKAYKITNGNQTGGAGNADYANIQYKFEAQDVANSGWNYISSSSDITISFWVKSSVAQTFYAYLRTQDGTSYHYPCSFALSADTWTKVTKTISGNSNLQINNDNGEGMQFTFMLFYGTNYTDSGVTLNAWGATGSGDVYSPDNTSTWYTTNDATFEITGFQLEVGPVATPFEHRSHGEELALCQRYYYLHHNNSKSGDEGNYRVACMGFASGSTEATGHIFFPVTMRANPSMDANSGVTGGIGYWRIGGGALGGDKYIDGAWTISSPTTRSARIYATIRNSVTSGEAGYIDGRNSASYMAFDSEL